MRVPPRGWLSPIRTMFTRSGEDGMTDEDMQPFPCPTLLLRRPNLNVVFDVSNTLYSPSQLRGAIAECVR